MSKYHADLTCYCEKCCDTANEWWEWRDESGENASGSRYWTKADAMADKALAAKDGLTVLNHVQGNTP